jgi:hypothetical protein
VTSIPGVVLGDAEIELEGGTGELATAGRLVGIAVPVTVAVAVDVTVLV